MQAQLAQSMCRVHSRPAIRVDKGGSHGRRPCAGVGARLVPARVDQPSIEPLAVIQVRVGDGIQRRRCLAMRRKKKKEKKEKEEKKKKREKRNESKEKGKQKTKDNTA